MMMVTTPPPEDVAASSPTRPDGTPWPHAMLAQVDGQLTLVCADTAGELLSLVVDDYPPTSDGPDDDARADALRADYAVRLAQGVQESMLATAVEQDEDVIVGADPRVVDAWFRSKDIRVDAELFGQDGSWPHPVPLVCLDLAYANAGQRPSGDNVLWVESRTETDLLASLDRLGVIVWFSDGADLTT